MSRRRQIEHHRRSLAQIREIMDSMKTLAFMETRKLTEQIVNQRQALQTIDSAAQDFISACPDALPDSSDLAPGYVVVGTQRGFCGDFNEQVKQCLEARIERERNRDPEVIVIGDRLHGKMPADLPVGTFLEGADVAEQVPTVLAHIVRAVHEIGRQRGPLSLTVVYHRHDQSKVSALPLLPPFREHAGARREHAVAPLLNLAPEQFFIGLVDTFLFAALRQALHESLMAENHRRVQHLDGAVRHLDDELESLRRQGNQLRQEEIIEEIEVILLGAANPVRPAPGEPNREGGDDPPKYDDSDRH